jgi:hypothetical protein
MTSLTAVSRAVAGIQYANDRIGDAHALAAQIDALPPQVEESTLRGLWVQLGRHATGTMVLLVEDDTTAAQARAACLAALTEAEPPRRGRGRPSRGVRVETKLRPDEVAQIEALVGVDGADRSEVIATLVRRSLT